MPKKIIKKPVDVVNSSNVNMNATIVTGIQPLELNVDLGRADLNDIVNKITAKINELVERTK